MGLPKETKDDEIRIRKGRGGAQWLLLEGGSQIRDRGSAYHRRRRRGDRTFKRRKKKGKRAPFLGLLRPTSKEKE